MGGGRRTAVGDPLTGRRFVAALGAAAAALLATAQPAAALPPGAWWYRVLDLQRAWGVEQGAGVTVAVVENGVKASLGDLQGQVLPGLDLSGRNPHAQHEDPSPGTDKFGHGSDMAILIAGTGQGAGMKGVAPKAKILPVALGRDAQGGYADSTIARGIRWAVDHGADIVNLSLGGPGACSPELADAVSYAYRHDIIVVASAADSPGPVSSPANCPGAIAVGGVDSAFKPWVNTPSGPEVDFVAPAFNLVNEELDGTLRGPDPKAAGTSQAAAIVSGTFALLRAKFPHDTARQLVTRALYNVHNGLGAGNVGKRIDDTLGYGEILPYYALTLSPPSAFANPIYDRFARELSSSSSSSAPAPSSPPPSRSGAPSSSPATSTSSSSDSGGVSSALVAAIVVAALIVLGAILFALRRRSRPT